MRVVLVTVRMMMMAMWWSLVAGRQHPKHIAHSQLEQKPELGEDE